MKYWLFKLDYDLQSASNAFVHCSKGIEKQSTFVLMMMIQDDHDSTHELHILGPFSTTPL